MQSSGKEILYLPELEAGMLKAKEGWMQVLIEAGAILLPAGCGPCNDAVIGPIHSGEVSISTATNNPPGRFGARDAKEFLVARIVAEAQRDA